MNSHDTHLYTKSGHRVEALNYTPVNIDCLCSIGGPRESLDRARTPRQSVGLRLFRIKRQCIDGSGDVSFEGGLISFVIVHERAGDTILYNLGNAPNI